MSTSSCCTLTLVSGCNVLNTQKSIDRSIITQHNTWTCVPYRIFAFNVICSICKCKIKWCVFVLQEPYTLYWFPESKVADKQHSRDLYTRTGLTRPLPITSRVTPACNQLLYLPASLILTSKHSSDARLVHLLSRWVVWECYCYCCCFAVWFADVQDFV